MEMLVRKTNDVIASEAMATQAKLEREICSCTHQRVVHGSAVAGLAAGHGQCYVGKCRCIKFSWHHEDESLVTAGR